MPERKQDKLLFKVSILSIAVMQATAQAVGGILNTMAASMPDVSAQAIQSLSTMPNAGCLAGLLLSPLACKALGEKRTTVIGIVLSIVAGCAPMVLADFTPILVSRIVLGFAFGLYTPLIVVLLSRFYKGDQLAGMIGIENAVGSVGSAICSLVSGLLVVLGWQAGFSIYLLSAVPLVLFTLFVNLDGESGQDPEASDAAASAPKAKAHVPAAGWGIGIGRFAFFVFQLPMAYALGTRVFESGVAGTTQEGASTMASTIYSFFTIIGIPVSLLFGAIRKRLGVFTVPVALAFNAVGFGLLAFGASVPALFAGGICSGVAFAVVVPYAYTLVAEVSPAEAMSTSTTIAMVCLNVGVFCSPFVLPTISSAVGDGSAHFVMLISTCAFAAFAVAVSLVAARFAARSKVE
ncbi:MAG: MFS transporter, partial [Atopobiaceae bacterium]